MASVSPPKPWERGGAAGASAGKLFSYQEVSAEASHSSS
jgi:hypothetical protein